MRLPKDPGVCLWTQKSRPQQQWAKLLGFILILPEAPHVFVLPVSYTCMFTVQICNKMPLAVSYYLTCFRTINQVGGS